MKKYVEQLLKGDDSSQSLHLALLVAAFVLITLGNLHVYSQVL